MNSECVISPFGRGGIEMTSEILCCGSWSADMGRGDEVTGSRFQLICLSLLQNFVLGGSKELVGMCNCPDDCEE